jgi:hypothetical protein
MLNNKIAYKLVKETEELQSDLPHKFTLNEATFKDNIVSAIYTDKHGEEHIVTVIDYLDKARV